jgi:AraC-like DNA-binding protein
MDHVSSLSWSSSSTVHPGYVQLLLACIQQQGLDPTSLFGIDVVNQITDLTDEQRQPVELWENLLHQAEVQVSGVRPDTDLALDMAEFIKPWDTGPVGFITMTCRDLRQATEALAQFYNLLNDVYALHARLDHARFQISLQALGLRPSFDLERLTLATIAWHARWLSRRPDLRFDAEFTEPAPSPARQARLTQTFGGTVRYNATQSSVSGPSAYADYQVSRGDHGVQGILREQLMARMQSMQRQSASFLHHIESLVQPQLERGTPSLEMIAHEAGTTPRTLQHRLEAHGLTFRGVLDRVRHQQAMLLIAQGELSLAEIALKLGFSSQSSFHIAFKRWTGHTPGQTRKRQAVTAAGSHQGVLS